MDGASPNAQKRIVGRPFEAGNAGGPGNPHAAAVGRIRSRLIALSTDERVDAMVLTLFSEAAKGGVVGVAAARLLLEYLLGKPMPMLPPEPERMEVLLTWAE